MGKYPKERVIMCMIGLGDWLCTQTEVVKLFNTTHLDRQPTISHSMLNQLEANFQQLGRVWNIIKSCRPSTAYLKKQHALFL